MKKVILVTGASSGIGKETALRLIRDGHLVYGAARRIENMKDLETAGGFAIKMDVLDDAALQHTVDQVIREQGRIDVLVNNAGYAIYGSVEETAISDARRQFEVNIFGLARITQLVIPHMRKQGSGTIINLSSMGGKVYFPLGAWYHGTKHALEGFSDSLRLELKQFGIHVVIIEPGAIKTEFGDVMTAPMVERSGTGPYARLSAAMTKGVTDSYNKPNGSSHPSVIAAVISKAIRARHPRTRYVAGKMARPMMFIRKWLGDRVYDAAVMSRVK